MLTLITYMMDKHGMDFSAMSRDPKNHYQETTAKLKGMVTRFISISEHYAPYCKNRGLIAPSEKKEEVKEAESVKGKMSLKWFKMKRTLRIQMMFLDLMKRDQNLNSLHFEILPILH